jgi:ABC-type transporter Mla subunit MlaD
MALNDLTPQLRTRLTRLEKLVGAFLGLAIVLLLVGLAFYARQVAARKGWFLLKLPYFTFVQHAAGLKVGDKVRLMGFDVGEITEITAQPPGDYYNVFVSFWVQERFAGYLWEDSRARVAAGDFLGNRYIEVTKGSNAPPTYAFAPLREILTDAAALSASQTNLVLAANLFDRTGTNLVKAVFSAVDARLLRDLAAAGISRAPVLDKAVQTKLPSAIWDSGRRGYVSYDTQSKGYFLPPDESPALTERLERVVNTVETALPGVFALTNQLNRLLDRASSAAANADSLMLSARPAVTNLGLVASNLSLISANLTTPRGALGDWLLPTNLSAQLTQTLASANAAITNTDTRLAATVENLTRALDHLAGITSNLHAQVDANTNLVSELSRLLVSTDEFVQGLRKHWLLRSAFKPAPTRATNAPPRKAVPPTLRNRP